MNSKPTQTSADPRTPLSKAHYADAFPCGDPDIGVPEISTGLGVSVARLILLIVSIVMMQMLGTHAQSIKTFNPVDSRRLANPPFEAGTAVTVQIYATGAEEATLADDRGVPVRLANARANRNGILSTTAVVNDFTTRTYTLIVKKLGGKQTQSRTLTIERRVFVWITTGERVRAGGSFPLTIRLSCTPMQVGWMGDVVLRLSADRHPELLSNLPTTLRFNNCEREKTFMIGTRSPASVIIPITAVRLEGPPTVVSLNGSINIYDMPQITRLEPIDINWCKGGLLHIHGNFFNSSEGRVRLTHRGEYTPYSEGDIYSRSPSITEADVVSVMPGPDARRPWIDMTLVCRVPLRTWGNYDVTVDSATLGSNPLPLNLPDAHPIVEMFEVTELSGAPPVLTESPHSYRITFRVRNASRVVISASGNGDFRNPPVTVSRQFLDNGINGCDAWEGQIESRIYTHDTSVVYSISAYSDYFPSAPRSRGRLLSRTTTPSSSGSGYGTFTYQNCNPNHHSVEVFYHEFPGADQWHSLAELGPVLGECPSTRSSYNTRSLNLKTGSRYWFVVVDTECRRVLGEPFAEACIVWHNDVPILGQDLGPELFIHP